MDFERLLKPCNREYVMDVEYLKGKNKTLNYSQYIVYLADVWVGNKERSKDVEEWWSKTLPKEINDGKEVLFKFKKISEHG